MFSGLAQGKKIDFFFQLEREAEFKCWHGLGGKQQAGWWDIEWVGGGSGTVLGEVTAVLEQGGAAGGFGGIRCSWGLEFGEVFELLVLIEQ